MGLQEAEHIKAISRIDEVAEKWQKVHGRPCGKGTLYIGRMENEQPAENPNREYHF